MITLPKPLPVKVRAAATAAMAITLSMLFCSGAPRYSQSIAADTNRSANDRRPAPDVGSPAGGEKSRYFQTGTATYYSNKFHGRKTASGERYNRYKFTAAHRTLPFGTMVRVTRLNNGKTVTVRINDRGPIRGNRIIDLSRAAAKAIDMISAGVVPVGIEIVK